MDTSTLEWQAFRYAAGELAADEAASFELVLEHDQAAREALARAVELGQALAAVPADDWHSAAVALPPKNTSWRVRAAWLVAGSLASLALVALLAWPRTPPNTITAALPAVESPELALAWSRGMAAEESALQDDNAATSANEISAASVLASALNDLAAEDDAEPSSEPAELDVPSWMLAAVSPSDMLPDELLPDGENNGPVELE